MTRPHIAIVFGTRPEAIKMFPLVHALKRDGSFDVSVIATAQHRELLDQVLDLSGIIPDYDLNLMSEGQSLDDLAARLLTSLGQTLDKCRPDRVMVHGDTLTTMMAAQASYFRKIPVAHVEAGLRSGDIYSPWPEEISRKVAGTIADLHFAPTKRAALALEREAVPASRILVTGNTAIDALLHTIALTRSGALSSDLTNEIRRKFAAQKVVLVTAHRRENHGESLLEITDALKSLAETEKIVIVFPMHPNPAVRTVVLQALDHTSNVLLLPPLPYPDFVQLIEISDIILTDSGGIQEEAPTLGKPVLVIRNETERPEAIEAGTARLIGITKAQIVRETKRLLHDPALRLKMSRRTNPFGDGRASQRIVERLTAVHKIDPPPKQSLIHAS